MRSWKHVWLVALALLVVVAAGCGGGESGEGVAAIDTPGQSGGSSQKGGDERSAQEKAMEWAQCMRAQGVQVEDPDANGMFQITPETSRGFDDAEFEAAREECGAPPTPSLPEPSEADQKKMQESMLAFARCMRANGVDMPDPTFRDGGASVQLPDPDEARSPEFQAAQKACDDHLQMPGRAGGSS